MSQEHLPLKKDMDWSNRLWLFCFWLKIQKTKKSATTMDTNSPDCSNNTDNSNNINVTTQTTVRNLGSHFYQSFGHLEELKIRGRV